MTYATLAGVRRSQREHLAALKRAMEEFGDPLELSINSSNARDFVSYETYASDEKWAKHASGVYVRIASLCEFGRPLAISQNTWIWKSDFVSMSLSARYPFNIYWHEPGSVDVDGKRVTKSGLRPFAMNVSVDGRRRYGLGGWSTHRVALTKWAADFVNDAPRKAILDGIALADRYVSEWREAIAAMAKNAEGTAS